MTKNTKLIQDKDIEQLEQDLYFQPLNAKSYSLFIQKLQKFLKIQSSYQTKLLSLQAQAQIMHHKQRGTLNAHSFTLQAHLKQILKQSPELTAVHFFLSEFEANPQQKVERLKICKSGSKKNSLFYILCLCKIAILNKENYDIRIEHYELLKNFILKNKRDSIVSQISTKEKFINFLSKVFSALEIIEIISIVYGLESGIEMINELLEKQKHSLQYKEEIFFVYGHMYYDYKMMEKAEQWFQKVLLINNKYFQAYFKLGYIFSEKQDEQAAIKYYEKALQLNPNYLNALLNKGVSYQNLGDMDKALDIFQQCINIDSTYSKAYLNMGGVHSSNNENQMAIFYFQKCLEIDRKDIKALNNIGICLSNLGREEDAIQYYKRCIYYNPKYSKAFINLGLSYESLNQMENAMLTYKQNIKANSEYYRSYLLLGDIYIKQGKKNQGINCLVQGLLKDENQYREISDKNLQKVCKKLVTLEKTKKLTQERYKYELQNLQKSCLWKQFLRREINHEISEFLQYNSKIEENI